MSRQRLKKSLDTVPARLRTLPVAIAAAATISCAVGGDPKPPELSLPPGYASAAETTEPSAPTDSDVPKQVVELGETVAAEWWTLFRSPDLDALIKEALAGSRTLESARAHLEAQQQTLAAARSALYPQLALNADVTREKESAATFGLPASALPLPENFTLLQVGPTASYDLDLFRGIRRRVARQGAIADVQRYQLGAAYLALTGNAVSEAIQLAASRAQLNALEDVLRIDRENLALVRQERQVGAVADNDVVSAENQLAVDETLQPGLDQQLHVARHALAVLIGRAPAQWSPPEFDLGRLSLPAQVPVSLPSALVHQRPDILAAEAEVHVAAVQVGVATTQLYPDLTLSAGLSATSLNGSYLFDPVNLVWSIAAGFTQPLFDAGMRRAERRAALAEFRASAADYQQTVLQAFGQVADILRALTNDSRLQAAEKRALDTASHSVALQRINYENGGTGILVLLDAQRQYQQAVLGEIRARAQRYLDTIQLQVAMGGGWSSNPDAAGSPEPSGQK